MTGICRNILSWYDLNGSLNIAFGTNSKLYVYRDGAVYDITPAGLAAGPVDGAGVGPVKQPRVVRPAGWIVEIQMG